MYDDDYNDINYYDPFLSDVYSLGRSLQVMMDDPSQNYHELEEIVKLMLVEKPQKRVNLFQLQDMLR